MALPRFRHPAPALATADAQAVADALLAFQLKVARRADEYARDNPSRSPLNLQCWLMAEAEILRHEFGLPTVRGLGDRRAHATPAA